MLNLQSISIPLSQQSINFAKVAYFIYVIMFYSYKIYVVIKEPVIWVTFAHP